jgi:hypothetical protein
VERPVRHAKGRSRRKADEVRGFIANHWASGLGSAALLSSSLLLLPPALVWVEGQQYTR